MRVGLPRVRALLTTIPQYGHFWPLVPLAESLQDAGHEVAVATAASFGDAVSATGLTHIPAGIAWAQALEQSAARNPEFARAAPKERGQRVIPEAFVGTAVPAMLADADGLLAWRPD